MTIFILSLVYFIVYFMTCGNFFLFDQLVNICHFLTCFFIKHDD